MQRQGTHRRHEPSALADANRPVLSVDKDKTESYMLMDHTLNLGAVSSFLQDMSLVTGVERWNIGQSNLGKIQKT